MKAEDTHVQPTAPFEAILTAFCGFCVITAIVGSAAACGKSTRVAYHFGILSVISCILSMAGFGYACK